MKRSYSFFFVILLLMLPVVSAGWFDWLMPEPQVFMVPFYPGDVNFTSVGISGDLHVNDLFANNIDANSVTSNFQINITEIDLNVLNDANFQGNVGILGSIFGDSGAGDMFRWDASSENFSVGFDINQNTTGGSAYQYAFGQGHDMKCDDCFTAGFENILLADQTMAFGSGHILEGQFGFAAGRNCNIKEQSGICLGEDLTNYVAGSTLVGDLNATGDSNFASLEANDTYLTNLTATGTITSGDITIFDATPILVFKDSDSLGAASVGFIEWRDSGGGRAGFLGNNTSGDDGFLWKNEQGGNIGIQTTGGGELRIFADINAQDNDITTTGTLKVNDLNATGDSNFGNIGVSGGSWLEGDLNVGGTSNLWNTIINGTQLIDVDNAEALLVRSDGDGGDRFVVSTTGNTGVGIGADAVLSSDLDFVYAGEDGADGASPTAGLGATLITGDGGDSDTGASFIGKAAGSLTITTGFGGGNEFTGAGPNNRGGAGGTAAFQTGRGGNATSTVKTNIGGSAGAYTFAPGNGGAATGANGGINTGGTGGSLSFSAGSGGTAANGATNNGGSGGNLNFQTGTGTDGADADGSSGSMNFRVATTTSGTMGEMTFFQDLVTEIAAFTSDQAGLRFMDNKATLYGDASDSKIYHDTSNLIIDPDLVGSGNVFIGATADDDLNTGTLHIQTPTATGGAGNDALISLFVLGGRGDDDIGLNAGEGSSSFLIGGTGGTSGGGSGGLGASVRIGGGEGGQAIDGTGGSLNLSVGQAGGGTGTDGKINFIGDETFTLALDTANTAVYTTTTGITKIDFSAMGLITTGDSNFVNLGASGGVWIEGDLNVGGDSFVSLVYGYMADHQELNFPTVDLEDVNIMVRIVLDEEFSSNNVTVSDSNFIILVAGLYKIVGNASFSGGVNKEYGVAAVINHSTHNGCHGHRSTGTGADIGSLTFPPCVRDLAVGDKITLQIEQETAVLVDPTIHDASLIITKIG